MIYIAIGVCVAFYWYWTSEDQLSTDYEISAASIAFVLVALTWPVLVVFTIMKYFRSQK